MNSFFVLAAYINAELTHCFPVVGTGTELLSLSSFYSYDCAASWDCVFDKQCTKWFIGVACNTITSNKSRHFDVCNSLFHKRFFSSIKRAKFDVARHKWWARKNNKTNERTRGYHKLDKTISIPQPSTFMHCYIDFGKDHKFHIFIFIMDIDWIPTAPIVQSNTIPKSALSSFYRGVRIAMQKCIDNTNNNSINNKIATIKAIPRTPCSIAHKFVKWQRRARLITTETERYRQLLIYLKQMKKIKLSL